MDKPIDTGQDVGKCTERRKPDDLRLHHRAVGIVTAQDLPRVVLRLLVAQRNLFLFAVKRLDIHFYRIADRNDIGRVLDTIPGEFGNVDHAVHTADVHERAVARQ